MRACVRACLDTCVRAVKLSCFHTLLIPVRQPYFENQQNQHTHARTHTHHTHATHTYTHTHARTYAHTPYTRDTHARTQSRKYSRCRSTSDVVYVTSKTCCMSGLSHGPWPRLFLQTSLLCLPARVRVFFFSIKTTE